MDRDMPLDRVDQPQLLDTVTRVGGCLEHTVALVVDGRVVILVVARSRRLSAGLWPRASLPDVQRSPVLSLG
jgi:hypothetical protein